MLFLGNTFFAVCCLFYLVWWSVAFKPDTKAPEPLSVMLFAATVIFGLAGLYLIIRGMIVSDFDRSLYPTYAVVCAGIGLYILLLILTSSLLHRQVTTELLLIIGWGILAFCEINALYGVERLGLVPSIVCCAAAVAIMAASMACYLVYYDLEPHRAYIDGMLPLILVGAAMASFAVLSFKK